MQTFIIILVIVILMVMISAVSYMIYKNFSNVVVVKLDNNALKDNANFSAQPQKPTVSTTSLPTSLDTMASEQLNTLAYVYAQPPPLPYPGYVFPPAGYPYPFSYNSKQLGGGYYYHGDGKRRRTKN